MRKAMRLVFRLASEDLPAVILGLVPFGVTFAVVSRYLFGQPVRGMNESVILLTIWLVYLGLASAARQNLHPGFELVPRPKNPSARRAMDRLRDGMMVIIAVTLVYYGNRFATSTGLTFLTLGIGKRWAWIALPIGTAFVSLYLLHRIWRPNRSEVADGGMETEEQALT